MENAILNHSVSAKFPLPAVEEKSPAVVRRSFIHEVPQITSRRSVPVRIPGFDAHNPKQNQLLASLPEADFQRLLPHLELAAMPLNMVVCEGNDQMQHVYFLTNSIVSLLYETLDGASAETAVIGHEGMVGVTSFMGGGPAQCRAIVKSAGYGFRMKANVLKEEFGRSPSLQQALLRYTQALYFQASQMAVCNRHHNVVQQLCRMLLLSLDRLNTNELFMKQGSIAAMLGVRRESVTGAAAKLQEEGLIHYHRGHITINDRPGLEQRVCECYSVVRKEYDHLACGCPGH